MYYTLGGTDWLTKEILCHIWINKFTLVNHEASCCLMHFKVMNFPWKSKTVNPPVFNAFYQI